MHRARPQWRAGAGMPTTLARMPATSLRSRAPLFEDADLHDGVVSRHQLHERGYDKDAIRANVAAQRWQAIGRKVVVLHNGPLTPRQREWVAVIGQRDAALAGLTAAAAGISCGELNSAGFAVCNLPVASSSASSRPSVSVGRMCSMVSASRST